MISLLTGLCYYCFNNKVLNVFCRCHKTAFNLLLAVSFSASFKSGTIPNSTKARMLTNIAGFLLPFYLDLFCLKQTESIYDAYTLLCLHIAFWSLLVLVAAILLCN